MACSLSVSDTASWAGRELQKARQRSAAYRIERGSSDAQTRREGVSPSLRVDRRASLLRLLDLRVAFMQPRRVAWGALGAVPLLQHLFR